MPSGFQEYHTMSNLFDAGAESIALASGRPLSQVRVEIFHPVPTMPAGSLFAERFAQTCNACDAVAPEAAENEAGYCTSCVREANAGIFER